MNKLITSTAVPTRELKLERVVTERPLFFQGHGQADGGPAPNARQGERL